jgi:hypothetical protein
MSTLSECAEFSGSIGAEVSIDSLAVGARMVWWIVEIWKFKPNG